jgi:hypothetical protein
MQARAMTAVIAALAAGAALAQPSHHRAVQFGDEMVTLKLSHAPFDQERHRLWDASVEATDPVEQERLWRVRWEDYGEAVALQSLSIYHLERGDLVLGYAHLYAVDKIAKWHASVAPIEPGPILKRHFAEIEADMALVGRELTESQRQAGVALAAELIRNNPNCCALP